MKILQYNVLNGCAQQERFNKFNDWIKKQTYDVIGFNELNGWTNEKLKEYAIKWGYQYSYLFEMNSSPYRIGVIAKTSIQLIEATESLFHHGLLHVKISGNHFLLSHFSPHSNAHREKEASEIVKRIEKLHHEPVIVMGDLNTLSPLDNSYYNKENQKDYQPIKMLLDCGLEDTTTSASFNYTFPTSLLHETKLEEKVRIDYILVNAKLKKFNPTSSVIYDDEVEKLSDHYPVSCSWGNE